VAGTGCASVPRAVLAISDDVRYFLTALLLVVGGILPIVNPVGSAPMFLAMTHGADEGTRAQLAAKIALNSFLLIMGSLIFGAYVLAEQKSGVDFSVPGALIVLLIVAAVSAAPREGGRPTAIVAGIASAVAVVGGAALVGGQQFAFSTSFQLVQSVMVPGVAGVVLAPMVYWSGRRLVLANSRWASAVPAFAGSVLWLVLLMGPAVDIVGAATLAGGALVAIVGVRIMVRGLTDRARQDAPLA